MGLIVLLQNKFKKLLKPECLSGLLATRQVHIDCYRADGTAARSF